MSDTCIFDASAVLAYMQQEPGQDKVEAALDAGPCWISSVNLCEVLGKFCEKSVPVDEALQAVSGLGLVVKDFDSKLAVEAAALRPRTKTIGASLGDRACLALAEQAMRDGVVPVIITSESLWSRLKWPFKIVTIR